MKIRVKSFISRWEISQNWQLLYPFLGIATSFYLGYRLCVKLFEFSLLLNMLIGFVLGIFILKFFVFSIKKMESKWIVNERWELIRIFIIFAITGSSSVFVGRPIIKLIGISSENFGPILYGIVFVFVSLIFYPILLVFCGFVLGNSNSFGILKKKCWEGLALADF